ncbi:amidase [Crossiella sp. CA-258035]|uniref:amidase n=1 Tax=Crossiella sp. CA-258035 TaxID=2981138 RepID=UPI0024BD2BA6|nr:amidase [Crossiella sp. CA-258035]WHT16325.1 amidase [Crossiella sp. CA-258035]
MHHHLPRSSPPGSRVLLALGLGLTLLATGCTGPEPSQPPKPFVLQDAGIAEIGRALGSGALTSVELTAMYLNRIQAYDANGIRLNSVVVPNPEALAEAAAADQRRAAGKVLGPLDGIPFTVKDSYMVKGLTVASGSPAFKDLVAGSDAFTVRKIREAGGVLIGKTNMPPMAAGGMQRGLYGRPESPYHRDYLAAAWNSGSSNGSAVATAANFAVFGMGEETVSSGRSPASNNALVAYTPSRGLLSIRGNWPLWPVMDVIVPQTRGMDDLLTLLNTIAVKDEQTATDFWRDQRAVALPSVEQLRPADHASLRKPDALRGKRLGVPKIYIGEDLGGTDPIEIRPSVRVLWQQAAEDLRKLGAEVVPVDFPVAHNQELDRVGAVSAYERGLLPPDFLRTMEKVDAYSAERFLKSVGDPRLSSWTQVDMAKVFPVDPGSIEEKEGVDNLEFFRNHPRLVAEGVPNQWSEVPGLAESLRGLENTRKADFEDWLKARGLDGVVFPANTDIGRAEADVDKAANAAARKNGTRLSTMNQTMRLLGIPSVSVPMGLMEDTRMPVNLTFAGPAYQDNTLLSFAYAYEQATHRRVPPTRPAPLADETVELAKNPFPEPGTRTERDGPQVTLTSTVDGEALKVNGTAADPSGIAQTRLYVNGERLTTTGDEKAWAAEVPLAKYRSPGAHRADSLLVLAVVKDRGGNTTVKTVTTPLK